MEKREKFITQHLEIHKHFGNEDFLFKLGKKKYSQFSITKTIHKE